MTNVTRIKHLRAQDYGVAGLSTTDVDWLIAEVDRMTAERDRYKAWQDGVMAQKRKFWWVADTNGDGRLLSADHYVSRFIAVDRVELIVRPQPLKENE